MSGPLKIPPEEELLFIRSLLIPAFTVNNLDTLEKRCDWLAHRAADKEWDPRIAAELIDRFRAVNNLNEAKKERKNAEKAMKRHEKEKEKERQNQASAAQAKWGKTASVPDHLTLDFHRDLLPWQDCQYVVPGSADAPDWLKCDLPRRPFAVADASTVDLALPVDGNPFYRAMGKNLVNQLKAVVTAYSHTLLLGCSGCGKTSACLALARERYVIYLEVPGHKSLPSQQRGFRMSAEMWSTAADFLTTTKDVRGALYVEVFARLAVLQHLLQEADLTPLRWLIFTMSEAGSTRIGHIVGTMEKENIGIHNTDVNALQASVTALIAQRQSASGSAGTATRDHSPVVVVDELQVLGSRTVTNSHGEKLSLMRATVNAACLLDVSVVWSGTRLHVMTSMSETSAFGKTLLNLRKLNVIGEYHYLERAEVEGLLRQVLHLEGVAPSALAQLSYGLQGRARTCAGFISHLFTPRSAALQPGAVLRDVILEVYEDFMTSTVIQRVHQDLDSYRKLPRFSLNSDDTGYLFCCTMLPSIQYPGGFGTRLNCIAFTEVVREDTAGCEKMVVAPTEGAQGEEADAVKFIFTYRFGEPSLQAALLSYARKRPHVADQGICRLLESAKTPSALGQYVDFAVVMSLLGKGLLFLQELLQGTEFEQFSKYTLSLSRVVCTSSSDDQYEWFKRVLEDPDDCEFSLLPGVPVKNIVILPSVLSGADAICVAMPEGEPEEQTFIAQRTRKRRAAPPPEMVLIHICCASYEGGAPAAKHEDQKRKSGDQFSHLIKRKCAAAKAYQAAAVAHADRYAVIPVLVEIPSKKTPRNEEGVVMVTETTRGPLLLSPEAISALTHPRGTSSAPAGAKG